MGVKEASAGSMAATSKSGVTTSLEASPSSVQTSAVRAATSSSSTLHAPTAGHEAAPGDDDGPSRSDVVALAASLLYIEFARRVCDIVSHAE